MVNKVDTCMNSRASKWAHALLTITVQLEELVFFQREAREGLAIIEFIFLPPSCFPSCSLIFLISQIARLYSLVLWRVELHNLSQVREESC